MRFNVILAFSLIAAGLLVNQWLLTYLFSDTVGDEIALTNKIVLWSLQVFCLGTGLLIIRRKNSPRPLSIIKVSAKIFIITVLTFLLLEQATRLYVFGWGSFRYTKMNNVHSFGVSGLIKPSTHLELIYEFKPNLDTYHRMARLQTNSYGLRDKQYTIQKPPRTFRVAVLGDSFTMPSGVDINDAFHTLLEERLNAESADISYEFINFAIGGYDPEQYLASLKYKALDYEPDLVLYCLCGAYEPYRAEIHKKQKYQVKPKQNSFWLSYFLERLIYVKNNITNFRKDNKPIKLFTKPAHEEKLKNIFSELGQISSTRNMPVCVVILRHFCGDRQENDRIMHLAAEHGLFFINTGPSFQDTELSQYIIYKIDFHPNAKANAKFAEVIYDYLKEQNLLNLN
ncbi:SGNH/GDSL hydrolase family protein [Planctomycetota bacterium]